MRHLKSPTFTETPQVGQKEELFRKQTNLHMTSGFKTELQKGRKIFI